MSPQNLTNVYNQNPTLQGQYTLQQYLDLFGQGSTPTTPTPTPTPNPTPTPVQPGIINQNINQYQGGNGGDGGPQGIAAVPGTYGKEYTGMTMPNGTPIGSMVEMEGPGIIDSLKNTSSDLFSLYQKYSPLGMIGAAIQKNKAFKTAQTNKALEQIEMQRKIREAEANKKSAREAYMARAQANANRRNNDGSGNTTNVTGFGKSGLGRDPDDKMAKGGMVGRTSYFNGGIVSLRRR